MLFENLPTGPQQNAYLFSLGRNAIFAACKALRLKAGDEILTPAFDCDGTKQPFRVLGLKLRYYKIDPNTFNVDLNDLSQKITSQSKMIHIINYFDFPQRWNELLTLRKQSNIPVIEDNAYSYFSKYEGQILGSFGDFSINSFRKSLNLIGGGLLRINNEKYPCMLPLSTSKTLFYRSELKPTLLYLRSKVGLMRTPSVIRKHLTYPDVPLYDNGGGSVPTVSSRDQIGKEFSVDYLRSISRLNMYELRQLTQKDLIHVSRLKRTYYQELRRSMELLKGIEVMGAPLAENCFPFGVPLIIHSHRDTFYKTLIKKYQVLAWPTYPQDVLTQKSCFPEVEYLGKKLLIINLPSHFILKPHFSHYMENLVDDFRRLTKVNL
jgi:hypothetical protein